MQLIIDRFEDDIAVCEKSDRSMVNIPRQKIPANAKEGDVLIIEGDDIRIDSIETRKREEAIRGRMRKLWKKKQ
jgi:uncharacterized Zn finger protein